jgi:hypothetical protein
VVAEAARQILLRAPLLARRKSAARDALGTRNAAVVLREMGQDREQQRIDDSRRSGARFGGYAAWDDAVGAGDPRRRRKLTMTCGCANGWSIHGLDRAIAWSKQVPVADLRIFLGHARLHLLGGVKIQTGDRHWHIGEDGILTACDRAHLACRVARLQPSSPDFYDRSADQTRYPLSNRLCQRLDGASLEHFTMRRSHQLPVGCIGPCWGLQIICQAPSGRIELSALPELLQRVSAHDMG